MKIDSSVLKQLRIDNGMRLSDVAARLQISEATISRYESGQIQKVSPRILIGYSKLFRVPINFLCENSDSDWVDALQEAGLRDPRVKGFIEYLEEQAEREMNDINLSNEELDIAVAYRNADERTRELVRYALKISQEISPDNKEGDR